MPEIIPYLYPWDVLDDDMVARLTRLGTRRVAMAAYYHAVRAATPRHQGHRFVDAAWSALYVDTTRHGVLPLEAPAWTARNAFTLARRRLNDAGIAASAWITPTHADPRRPGTTAARVVDAFGTVHQHALCPVTADVEDLIERVVTSVVDAGTDGLVIEAVGQLGIDHAHLHDKTVGADWSDDERRLLSICFCAACRDARGSDSTAWLREIVRDALSGRVAPAEALSMVAELVLPLREKTTRRIWGRIRRAAGSHPQAVHVTDDPWATGPSTPAGWVPGASTVIAPGWHRGDSASLSRIREAVPDARLAAYVTVLPPTEPRTDSFRRHIGSLVDMGVEELHLYHLGLASNTRLALAEDIVAAFTD
ncbi:hypothetical protein GCM10027416_02070 [Okibacterium endophyticum]